MGRRFRQIMRRVWPGGQGTTGSLRHAEPSQEMSCAWYDDAFATRATYRDHYTLSRYYCLWTVLVDRLHRDGVRRVLEVGCGPGQLAEFMLDQGVTRYVGFDFSKVAIELANGKRLANARFLVDDATTTSLFEEVEYDAIVCTEVLEHIEADLLVVSRFREGSRCICTVPSFPYSSHVRHFESEAEVTDRYNRYFAHLDVSTVRRADSPTGVYYILDGVRG